jgi:hypothetical protein
MASSRWSARLAMGRLRDESLAVILPRQPLALLYCLPTSPRPEVDGRHEDQGEGGPFFQSTRHTRQMPGHRRKLIRDNALRHTRLSGAVPRHCRVYPTASSVGVPLLSGWRVVSGDGYERTNEIIPSSPDSAPTG